ncbi:hypothetical protein DF035_35080 [Burkholderia contaminans]|nr:hypothetical protein DF035_35080 [Burkholderia contaminans]
MTERAGLIDLHIHDLRHEGISRVAETGQFSLVDLQAFSGHRDTRMLLRYAHLCTRQLADRLDAAFGSAAPHARLNVMHRGRRRLRAGSGLTLAAIAGDFTGQPSAAAVDVDAAGAASPQTMYWRSGARRPCKVAFEPSTQRQPALPPLPRLPPGCNRHMGQRRWRGPMCWQ